ncbi:phosphate ABC transporter substrate-binding protein [Clostridium luticellarii]|jgi:phosphate transport system substrate-binding protein|uniref:Phosphate-binding protein n=1 Tax=Clostridium luticellarii TaxID=1691940 RepID=A0A2T0BRH9_9CLOT|nr:phosphate ABC transporter substrate-binding protein [Clostridium luticellarii]MCI1943838.1 phosphate ABC transporter substrate-binding protein [Clostridium luticellarii]MCI1967099.1 phosphate ABC transporter substrate-binding protein [Clostridium luticellarii]MCI1994466.1 phosphate ABC transporter substrate-binding protein [Clostridium luticellarii]MCI2038581.1 phosphate ABC transporter substrate-binding protein [Clostridium luticellarii]PRR86455.1 Phosphate-binding protein PstS 1 precursor
MRKKGFKSLIVTLAVVLITGVFAGCGGNTGGDSSQGNTTKDDSKKELSGSITLAGSTALQPLAEEIGKSFQQKNPKVTVNVQGGGSGTGLNLALEGTANIGNSDVTAESKLDADKAKQLVDHQVCAIGFAVVVNPSVKVDNLTKDQIQKIFTGEITNWKDVGGDDMKINVINRTKSSGTRATFKDTVMGGKDEKEGLGTTQDSNGNVENAIKTTEGSISYLALSYLTDSVKANVKALKIEGVEATSENITAKKYPFWSYEHMYTKGEAKDPEKAFIDYVLSDENTETIKKLGYIPMSEMK